MTRLKPILILAVLAAAGLLAADPEFDRLVSLILAQLEQQAKSDKLLIQQTTLLRQRLQKAEKDLATNQFSVAREAVLSREALVAANEIIANPRRTKLHLDTFLRRAAEQDEEVLNRAIEGPAATRLETSRLAAQVRARQAVLRDLRRDVAALSRFPTPVERLNFVTENVKLIQSALGQRSSAGVTQ